MGDRPISKPPPAKDNKRKRYGHIQTQGAFEPKIPSIVQVKTCVPSAMRPLQFIPHLVSSSSLGPVRWCPGSTAALRLIVHAFSISFIESPGSVVRTVARLWAGRSEFRIPVGVRDFISAPEGPDRLRDPPSLPFNGYSSSFSECD
jgi:hypothetical protein